MTQAPSGPIINGAQWGAFPFAPPASIVDDLDIKLAHILPDVQSYFSADAVVKTLASPLGFYDRCLQGSQFSGETTGNSPTDGALIGSLAAITCVNSSNKSLRATKNTTLLAGGGFSMLIACNVSSALLAASTVFRTLTSKGTASLTRFHILLLSSSNQWVVGCPLNTGAAQNLATAAAPTVGPHVICVSVAADQTVKLYDNRSGTAAGSGTLTAPLASLTDRWTIGGPPGGVSPLLCWDGLMARAYFMERNALHGTSANDASRAAAMALLGTALGISIDPT